MRRYLQPHLLALAFISYATPVFAKFDPTKEPISDERHDITTKVLEIEKNLNNTQSVIRNTERSNAYEWFVSKKARTHTNYLARAAIAAGVRKFDMQAYDYVAEGHLYPFGEMSYEGLGDDQAKIEKAKEKFMREYLAKLKRKEKEVQKELDAFYTVADKIKDKDQRQRVQKYYAYYAFDPTVGGSVDEKSFEAVTKDFFAALEYNSVFKNEIPDKYIIERTRTRIEYVMRYENDNPKNKEMLAQLVEFLPRADAALKAHGYSGVREAQFFGLEKLLSLIDLEGHFKKLDSSGQFELIKKFLPYVGVNNLIANYSILAPADRRLLTRTQREAYLEERKRFLQDHAEDLKPILAEALKSKPGRFDHSLCLDLEAASELREYRDLAIPTDIKSFSIKHEYREHPLQAMVAYEISDRETQDKMVEFLDIDRAPDHGFVENPPALEEGIRNWMKSDVRNFESALRVFTEYKNKVLVLPIEKRQLDSFVSGMLESSIKPFTLDHLVALDRYFSETHRPSRGMEEMELEKRNTLLEPFRRVLERQVRLKPDEFSKVPKDSLHADFVQKVIIQAKADAAWDKMSLIEKLRYINEGKYKNSLSPNVEKHQAFMADLEKNWKQISLSDKRAFYKNWKEAYEGDYTLHKAFMVVPPKNYYASEKDAVYEALIKHPFWNVVLPDEAIDYEFRDAKIKWLFTEDKFFTLGEKCASAQYESENLKQRILEQLETGGTLNRGILYCSLYLITVISLEPRQCKSGPIRKARDVYSAEEIAKIRKALEKDGRDQIDSQYLASFFDDENSKKSKRPDTEEDSGSHKQNHGP